MKSRSLSVFLAFLLVFSLVGLAAPPSKAYAAVTGGVTLGDGSFTQESGVTKPKPYFSVMPSHNVVGIEVKDADLNVRRTGEARFALTASTSSFDLKGTATPAAILTGDAAGTATFSGNGTATTFCLNGTVGACAAPVLPALRGRDTNKDGTLAPADVSATVGGVAATIAGVTTSNGYIVSVTLTAAPSTGTNNVVISYMISNYNQDTPGNTPLASVTLFYGADFTATTITPGGGAGYDYSTGVVTTTAIDGTVATTDSVLVAFTYDVQERLLDVPITSTSAAALGAGRTVTLVETTASSGIFRGTILLVDVTTNPCYAPSTTADSPGCNDYYIGDLKYSGALYVRDADTITLTYTDASNSAGAAQALTGTAKVDMTPPVLTLVSPGDKSSTNVNTITFTVDITDAAAGVDSTSLSFVRVTSTTTGATASLQGTLTPASGVLASPIANGYRATVLASAVGDGNIRWAVVATDAVGNTPRIVNDVNPAADFCGTNATKGTRGNSWSVTLGTTKPFMNSAKTGVAGVTDTRVQEAVFYLYPDTEVKTPTDNDIRDPPPGTTTFQAAPYPGQPVNCTTFGKLTDDTNVNLVTSTSTTKIADPTLAGTAGTAVKLVVTTSASGKMGLDKATIAAADFTVGGVAPATVAVGPAVSGVGYILYLTMPSKLPSDATPAVLVVGPFADSGGNILDPATLTDTEKASNYATVPAAADGLAPVLTVSAYGVKVGSNVASTSFTVSATSNEVLSATPTITICTDTNKNSRCDTGETTVGAGSTSTITLNQFQGTASITTPGLGVSLLQVTGTDVGSIQGVASVVVERDNAVAAPTIVPADTSTVNTVSPWITVNFSAEGSEYTGDTHATVTLTSATLDGLNVLANFLVGTVDNIAYTLTTTNLALGSHTVAVGYKDEAGNTGTATVSFTVVGKQPVSIRLDPGWNLISVPGPLEDPSITSVFKGMTTVQRVYGFDAAVGWQLSVYDAATGKWSGSLAAIQDGKGYWVYATNVVTTLRVFLADRQPTSPLPQYDLKAGWNLIGFTSLAATPEASVPVDSYLSSLGSGTARKWTSLVSFNPNPAVGYQSARGNTTFSAGFDVVATNAVVMPGKGYWIFLTSDGTLTP